MSPPGDPALDLIDLKFLPAWLKENEHGAARYADYEDAVDESGDLRPLGSERRRSRPGKQRGRLRTQDRRSERDRSRRRGEQPPRQRPSRKAALPGEASAIGSLPELEIRFLPRPDAFTNVAAQISAAPVAYSVYALARLFLQKPDRYQVRLTTKLENALYRLGDTSAISSDRHYLESTAFRLVRDEYYKVNVTLSEPIKGNFSSVARERSTGILLGPTNHHGYQPRLRRLYEQRFSRRMEFREFQRQIEVVSDPALVEAWKEEARKITTFTSLKESPPLTFNSEPEAERDFREKYLPSLISETHEVVIDGVSSRNMRDRGIARAIENAWSAEVHSPSNLMQELSAQLRAAGLQVFRHRKGMLFVSPVRPKLIDETAVSDSVRAILEAVKTSPRINRKDLAEKLIDAESQAEPAEKARLALAADIRWLVREGHIIEFNDGTLDLPRSKQTPTTEKDQPAVSDPGTLEGSPVSGGALPEPAAETRNDLRLDSPEHRPHSASGAGESDGVGLDPEPSNAGVQ